MGGLYSVGFVIWRGLASLRTVGKGAKEEIGKGSGKSNRGA